jgi:hypothetical protein
MKDKRFVAFIKALFGAGGVIILVITWARVMTLTDRILFTVIGLSGIFSALTIVIPFKYVLTKIGVVRNLPQAQAGKERG